VTRLITADDIIALNPCSAWPADKIRRMVGRGITADRIARDERIPLADRRWVLCHLLARGPQPDRPALVRWSCAIALRAVDHITDEESHAAARECIETAIRWSVGDATADQVWSARSLVYDHWPAAYAAAYAADAAAYDAAYAAYAAYAAAYAAAYLIDLAAIIDSEVRQ
jgi:hypothetical protein